MNVCLIGGTGNIGTAIARQLYGEGQKVVGCSRTLPTEADEKFFTELIQCDRHNPTALARRMDHRRFDVVIDLACFTAADAEAAAEIFADRTDHYIFCSTVCVYGTWHNWRSMPIAENDARNPTTQYGKNKRAAEQVFTNAYLKNGFPVTTIRPSTTHGPKQGLFRQIAAEFSWLDRTKKGKPIAVCNQGATHHQFMHVDGLAQIISGIVKRRGQTVGETFNAAGPVTTWAEYHMAAMRVFGKVDLVDVPHSAITSTTVPGSNIFTDIFRHDSYYSTSKLQRLLLPDKYPTTTLEDDINSIAEKLFETGQVPNSDHSTWEDKLITQAGAK